MNISVFEIKVSWKTIVFSQKQKQTKQNLTKNI